MNKQFQKTVDALKKTAQGKERECWGVAHGEGGQEL